MHVILDKILFEKNNEDISCQSYSLTVDDVKISESFSNFKSSINSFKKNILPNLIKIGFDKISDKEKTIELIRQRQNLNENIEIKEFLKDFRII